MEGKYCPVYLQKTREENNSMFHEQTEQVRLVTDSRGATREEQAVFSHDASSVNKVNGGRIFVKARSMRIWEQVKLFFWVYIDLSVLGQVAIFIVGVVPLCLAAVGLSIYGHKFDYIVAAKPSLGQNEQLGSTVSGSSSTASDTKKTDKKRKRKVEKPSVQRGKQPGRGEERKSSRPRPDEECAILSHTPAPRLDEDDPPVWSCDAELGQESKGDGELERDSGDGELGATLGGGARELESGGSDVGRGISSARGSSSGRGEALTSAAGDGLLPSACPRSLRGGGVSASSSRDGFLPPSSSPSCSRGGRGGASSSTVQNSPLPSEPSSPSSAESDLVVYHRFNNELIGDEDSSSPACQENVCENVSDHEALNSDVLLIHGTVVHRLPVLP